MRVPSYRLHKSTGQAIVVIKRKFYYLGKFGTEESRQKYERIIGEYLANGRTAPSPAVRRSNGVTIRQLLAMYLEHCRTYYARAGEPTQEYHSHRYLAEKVNPLVGDIAAADFTPSGLESLRHAWIKAGNCRKYINQMAGRLVRVFKWAVAKELVPPDVWQRLQAVEGLKRGRCEAPDTPDIEPVADEIVDAAIEVMPDDLADMIRFQRLTGCRPGEVWILRPRDVDRSGEIWKYRPHHHKTEHHGKSRIIFIGPRGQAVISKYLLRPGDDLCFRRPFRGRPWERTSYRRAIHNACRLASVATFNANQIRHTVGTEVRQAYGLDGTQVILGHSKADTSEIYAELDMKKGEEIARRLG